MHIPHTHPRLAQVEIPAAYLCDRQLTSWRSLLTWDDCISLNMWRTDLFDHSTTPRSAKSLASSAVYSAQQRSTNQSFYFRQWGSSTKSSYFPRSSFFLPPVWKMLPSEQASRRTSLEATGLIQVYLALALLLIGIIGKHRLQNWLQPALYRDFPKLLLRHDKSFYVAVSGDGAADHHDDKVLDGAAIYSAGVCSCLSALFVLLGACSIHCTRTDHATPSRRILLVGIIPATSFWLSPPLLLSNIHQAFYGTWKPGTIRFLLWS